jgi:betaine-aldehyde dehydrogenase
MGMAAATIKKTTLELGGKSPTIVFKNADLEAAVRGTLATIFLNQGQMCVAGSRLLVEQGIHDAFVEALVEKARKIRLGNGMEPETAMGPLISAAHREKVMGFVKSGMQEGARLVTGGRIPEGKAFEKGFFLEPTVFDGVNKEMGIAREEIFGPVLSVFSFASLDEAVALANATRYGLAASIWTNDMYQAYECARRIRAGTIWINTYGNFFSEVPFGGYRESGMGRELGTAGLREYAELKSITMDMSPDRRSLITKWYGL